MKLKIFYLLTSIVTSAIAADTNNYNIDYDGPLRLTDEPSTLTMPTRVSVFISKPKTDFDKTYAETLMKNGSPAYSTTNALEIAALVFALKQEDNEDRITNESRHVGRTYHILLFQEKSNTVMQYRVFEPTDMRTIWCGVYPRTITGFGYFDKEIGPWLHSRLTNSIALPTNMSK